MLSLRKNTGGTVAAAPRNDVSASSSSSSHGGHNYPQQQQSNTTHSYRLLTLFLLALTFFTVHISGYVWEENRYNELPSADAQDAIFNVASLQRTRSIVDKLTEGQRIAGTSGAEVVAKNYIMSVIEDIQKNASPEFNIEVDVQHPTGVFTLEFLNGFTNVYCNITNIAVRLSLTKDKDLINGLPSVLINAHFDSFVSSVGASDDVVGVATMLEVLRLISGKEHHKTHSNGIFLKNSIIFLFNGAEESNLQAAHGFVTQHKWSKNIRTLINMEALGAGVKERVFQCNSPWVARLYGKSVPFPYSSSIAHELFQKVLWRAAATDWRAFVQYGPPGIVGTDSAYVDNGYVYHTSFDTSAMVKDGTIVHTGANLLQFSLAMSAAEELKLPFKDWVELNNLQLDDKGEIVDRFDSHFIFNDLFGLVHVTYAGWQVYAIHFGASILALLFCWYELRSLAVMKAILLDTWHSVLVHCAVGIATGIVYASLAPMRWYDGGLVYALAIFIPPLIVTEYWLVQRRYNAASTAAAEAAAAIEANDGKTVIPTTPSKVTSALSSSHSRTDESVVVIDPAVYWRFSGMLHWSVALFLYTLVGHRGAILSLFWTVGSLFTYALRVSFMGNIKSNTAGRKNAASAIVECEQRQALENSFSKTFCIECLSSICLLLPSVLWISLIRYFFVMLIPMLGKTGTVIQGDVAMGLLMGLMIGSFMRVPMFNIYAFRGYMISAHSSGTSGGMSSSSISIGANNMLSQGLTYTYRRFLRMCGTVVGCFWFGLLAYSMVYTDSYSESRPKRLWIHHIRRDLTGLGEGTDSGTWLSGFDGRGMQPLEQYAIYQQQIRHLDGSKQSPSLSYLDGRFDTASFRGTWLGRMAAVPSDFTTTIADASSPTIGQPLPNENTLSVGEDVPSTSNERSGVIRKREKPTGMEPRQQPQPHHSPVADARMHSKGYNCWVMDGECFMYWPFYFPVADALRDSIYIPGPPPVFTTAIPTASSSAASGGGGVLTATTASKGAAEMKEFPPGDGGLPDESDKDLVFAASSTPLQHHHHHHHHQHHNSPNSKSESNITMRISASDVHQINHGDSSGNRVVSLFLQGPSHMTLIIRDNAAGARIPKWGFLQSTQLFRSTTEGPYKQEEAVAAFKSQVLEQHDTPSARTLDGVHYIQIGFGLCNGACAIRVDFTVLGAEPVEVTAYAHHVLMTNTPQLKELQEALPQWSKGAEWTNFVSTLVATRV